MFENFNNVELGSASLEYSYKIANAAMQYKHFHGVNISECYGGEERSGQTLEARFFFPQGKLRAWEILPEFLLNFHLGTTNATSNPRLEYKKYKNGQQIGAYYTALNQIGVGTSNGTPDFIHTVQVDYKNATYWSGGADTLYVQMANHNNYTEKWSEQIEIRLTCEPKNPIILKALNRYGGWSYFVFGVQQQRTLTTTNGTEFSNTPQSVQEINPESWLLGKTSRSDLLVGAENLDNDDLIIIREILSSPLVKIYAKDEDNFWDGVAEWLDVKVSAGGYVLQNTKSNLHRVEFKIQFSEYNLQTL